MRHTGAIPLSGSGMNAQQELEEREQGLERKSLTARGVHEALLAEGNSELDRSWQALGWSGFASGISIGLSLLAEGILHAGLPETSWSPLISSLGYSVGFIVVILARHQLFTETTLTAFLPFLHNRSCFRKMIRLWGVVLTTNLLGAMVFAWTISRPSVASADLQHAFVEIFHDAAQFDPLPAFLRGILGGWIIALTVWLLPSAETARIWVVALMTYLIAAAELTHIIAGSVEHFYGIITGHQTWSAYLTHYFLPVLTGNVLGGVVLVAAVNHAQTVTPRRARASAPPSRR